MNLFRLAALISVGEVRRSAPVLEEPVSSVFCPGGTCEFCFFTLWFCPWLLEDLLIWHGHDFTGLCEASAEGQGAPTFIIS